MKNIAAIAALMLATAGVSHAQTIPVTAANFAKAETAWNMNNWAKLGADKDILHVREVTPVGPEAPTVRMNWDTLYSIRIVKVSDDGRFSLTMPETDLYVSAQIVDEDGFSPAWRAEKGVEHEIEINTDYAFIVFRTELEDRLSEDAISAVHAVQDQIIVSGVMKDSPYIMPDYDQEQLEKLRVAYKEEFLAAGIDFTFAKGPGEIDQHILDLSHAAGWGGYPPELEFSNAYMSSKNIPGDTCYSISFEDPKNKFFTSFTLYDVDGYLIEGNSFIRSSEWQANEDGTVTLHFNCADNAVNNLSSGGEQFNYTIRNYGVSQTVLDGAFRPLEPQVVSQ